MIEDLGHAKTESIFRTPYFNLDRVTIKAGASLDQSLADGFHHLFLHQGTVKAGDTTLEQGRSYVLPAALGKYIVSAGDKDAVILKTYLPVG